MEIETLPSIPIGDLQTIGCIAPHCDFCGLDLDDAGECCICDVRYTVVDDPPPDERSC
jgi:hypothetical protein